MYQRGKISLVLRCFVQIFIVVRYGVWFTDKSMKLLKDTYNRSFRILMGLEHRTSMSAEFIVRDMDPFVVIMREAVASFRKCMFSSKNILVSTVGILCLL